jgi:hypothetical protein
MDHIVDFDWHNEVGVADWLETKEPDVAAIDAMKDFVECVASDLANG